MFDENLAREYSHKLNRYGRYTTNSQKNSFSVAIIPYTFEHTNFHDLKVGSTVNLEFDIIGKYIAKMNS